MAAEIIQLEIHLALLMPTICSLQQMRIDSS